MGLFVPELSSSVPQDLPEDERLQKLSMAVLEVNDMLL